jgi:hypothetical protein
MTPLRKAAAMMALGAACCGFDLSAYGQSRIDIDTATHNAARTLRRYIRLRLNDADWKVYSPFIAWTDEPAWDCKWVDDAYRVGKATRSDNEVIIPVVHRRLGMFCSDFDFTPDPKEVTVTYKLQPHDGSWIVRAPIPDYPDISARTLMRELNTSSDSSGETAARRSQAKAAARKVWIASSNYHAAR